MLLCQLCVIQILLIWLTKNKYGYKYHPDVIMAGTNINDVMYHQHFLGSHKLIP